MGAKIDYKDFLTNLDARLSEYFKSHADFIHCKKGCSYCCENGDYPLSELELNYLMQGYVKLDNSTKITIQSNIKSMQKGKSCPFLIDKTCSVYTHRPIICRVHGLAYKVNNISKTPYCVKNGLNYSNVFDDKYLLTEPIEENLDTQSLLKDFEYGEIRNLYDWIIHKN